MKRATILLLLSVICFGQDEKKVDDAITARAIEGAKLLHSQMRDPDSFKIDQVWGMRSEKRGTTFCYLYYARNGFNGMNHSAAEYIEIENRKYAQRHHVDYELQDFDVDTDGYDYHCGAHAQKHDTALGDFTDQVKKALTAEANTASAK